MLKTYIFLSDTHFSQDRLGFFIPQSDYTYYTFTISSRTTTRRSGILKNGECELGRRWVVSGPPIFEAKNSWIAGSRA